jgi:hypothetical protein
MVERWQGWETWDTRPEEARVAHSTLASFRT